MTKIPAALYEPGILTVESEFNQSSSTFVPIGGAAELVTVTFGLLSGEMTNATFTGTGFVVEHEGPRVANGEIMRERHNWQMDGTSTEAGYTAGS